jgi:hypothetical protein
MDGRADWRRKRAAAAACCVDASAGVGRLGEPGMVMRAVVFTMALDPAADKQIES